MGELCYIHLRIWELPEQLVRLLAAAKDTFRHPLGTVRDFRSRQLTSADQPKGAFEALMMYSTWRKSCSSPRNTVAKHMRLLEEHGLIITEWTQIQMKNGIRKNGIRRKRKLALHHRSHARGLGAVLPAANDRTGASAKCSKKLSVQSTETICPPL